MPATNQFEDDLLDLIFNNVDSQDIGDSAGLQNSAAPGSTELTLHTSALAETDTLQTANEVAYTTYARPVQARTTSGWTISGTAPTMAANAALIQFGLMTSGGPDTVVDFGMTLNDGSTNYLQIYGALDASLTINNGVNPQFAAGAIEITLV